MVSVIENPKMIKRSTIEKENNSISSGLFQKIQYLTNILLPVIIELHSSAISRKTLVREDHFAASRQQLHVSCWLLLSPPLRVLIRAASYSIRN